MSRCLRPLACLALLSSPAWSEEGRLQGFLRTRAFVNSETDESGVAISHARLTLSGEPAPLWSYKLALDAASGEARLADAWASVQFHDHANLRMGNFKPAFLRTETVGVAHLLFLDRTDTARNPLWNERSIGAQLHGVEKEFAWAVSSQNPEGGPGEQQKLCASGVIHLAGFGPGPHEGAFGAEGPLNANVGAAFLEPGEPGSGSAVAVEAFATWEGWYAHAARVHLGEGIGDGDPWDATISRLLAPKWELGLRWQDHDDGQKTRSAGACLNHYISGHDLKWQLEALIQESDDPDEERTRISLGLTVGF